MSESVRDKINQHLQQTEIDLQKEIQEKLQVEEENQRIRRQQQINKAARVRYELERKEKLQSLLSSYRSDADTQKAADKELSDLVHTNIMKRKVANGTAREVVVPAHRLLRESTQSFSYEDHHPEHLLKMIETLEGENFINLTRFSLVEAARRAG